MDIESADAAPLTTTIPAPEASATDTIENIESAPTQLPEPESEPALIVHLPPASANEPDVVAKVPEQPGQPMAIERKKRSTSGSKINQLLNAKKQASKPKQQAKSASKAAKPKQNKRTTSTASTSGKENANKPKATKASKTAGTPAAATDLTAVPPSQATVPTTKAVKKPPTSNKKNPKPPAPGVAPNPSNQDLPQPATQTPSESQVHQPNSPPTLNPAQPAPSLPQAATTTTSSPKKPKTPKKATKPASAKKTPPPIQPTPNPKKTPQTAQPALPDPQPDQRPATIPAPVEQPVVKPAPEQPQADAEKKVEREPKEVKASTTAVNPGKKKVLKDFGWRYYPVGTQEVSYLKDWLLHTKERGAYIHKKALGIDEHLLADVGVKLAGGNAVHPVRDVPRHPNGDPFKDPALDDPLEAEADGPVSLGKRPPSTSNGLAPGKTPKVSMMMTGGDGTRKILDVASSIEERLLKYGRLGEDDSIIKRKAHNNFDYYAQDEFIDDPDDPLVNQAMEMPSSRFDDFFCLRGNIDTLKKHKKLSERIGEVRLRNRETKAKKTEEVRKKREELQIRSLKSKTPKPVVPAVETSKAPEVPIQEEPIPSEVPLVEVVTPN